MAFRKKHKSALLDAMTLKFIHEIYKIQSPPPPPKKKKKILKKKKKTFCNQTELQHSCRVPGDIEFIKRGSKRTNHKL